MEHGTGERPMVTHGENFAESLFVLRRTKQVDK